MNKKALLVVDMVYDFTNPKGLVFYPENEILLPKINEVIQTFRNKEELIIFMRHSYRKDKFEKNLMNMRPSCIEGSGGDELDSRLDINKKTDYIIKKRRYSAFYGTDLELILKEHKIEDVIIVGTKTNCCIRATVHDAYYNNYNVYVIRDCVATNDELVNSVHLDDIDKYFGKVISLKEFKGLFNEVD